MVIGTLCLVPAEKLRILPMNYSLHTLQAIAAGNSLVEVARAAILEREFRGAALLCCLIHYHGDQAFEIINGIVLDFQFAAAAVLVDIHFRGQPVGQLIDQCLAI